MAGQIDDIKARVDIVDLVSEYIRLKQTGTNWRALCPFHNEKSPSFMVSRDKQIWHCFGCNEGGDIFTFVQKMDNIEFPEALRLLAQKAGVKLIDQDPKMSSQRNRLMDSLVLTTKFWHQNLVEAAAGQKARDYLAKRGVSEKMIEEFKLGYAPDSWDNLIKFLKSQKYSDQEIFLAGLSVKKDRGIDFYDRFRDRLMFPINDFHGNPIGFSGRTLKADEVGGKYINTPQTLVYNKSLAIFNLDKAKQEIKKKNYAILVEGQMDVLAVFAAGYENVIASSGTALSLDQLKILKRYTNNLAISFDTDAAGQSAAKRGIDLALGEEVNVKVIVVPGGKDPDECIRHNINDWHSAVKNAKSIMEYYFDETFKKYDLKQVEGKKAAAKILLTAISKLGNKIEQTHWLQQLSEAINVPVDILRESLNQGEAKPAAPSNVGVKLKVAQPRSLNEMMAEQILAIGLKYPDNLPYIIDNLPVDLITDESLKQLYKQLIVYYTKNISGEINSFNYPEFSIQLKADNFSQLADKLVLLAEKDFFDFEPQVVGVELIKIVTSLKRAYYQSQLKDIEQRIKQEEKNKQSGEIENLNDEFNKIISQLQNLE
ncbi:MAG: DNA primase [Patescibacteria group bacterium]|nr:DNA primase [Patescibacteria group bacterium]